MYEKCDLRKTIFMGAKMGGVRFDECKIEETKLDVAGAMSYAQGKGFVLG